MITDAEPIQLFRALLGVALPWAAGYKLAIWFRPNNYIFSAACAHGFLLGQALVLFSLTLFDFFGVKFSFEKTCVLFVGYYLLATVAVPRSAFRHGKLDQREKLESLASAWEISLTTLFAVVLIVQASTVLIEIVSKPTFPWDAWRGWEPKAIQFFTNRALDAPVTTIGNFGVLSVSAQTWMMLALDDPKSPLTHLPWFFAYVSIGLAVFGFVIRYVSRFLATLASTLTLTLPLLSTHAALAGYADIWLCLAFTLAVFSTIETGDDSHPRGVVLCILYAILAILTKRAGVGFGVIAIALLVLNHTELFVLLRRPAIYRGLIIVGTSVLGLLAWNLVTFGDGNLIRIPGATYTMTLSPQLTPYIEALFLFSSWNLLAYAVVFFTIVNLRTKQRVRGLNFMGLAMLLSLIYVYTYFTILSPLSATDHTGLSRALIPLAPLSLTYCVLLLRTGNQPVRLDRTR